jgi:hypothetical protein
MVGHAAQNGRSHKATLGTSAGGELSTVSILCGGHRCGTSVPVAWRDNRVNFYNIYCCQKSIQTSRQESTACSNRWGIVGPEKGHISKEEITDECQQNSVHSWLARWSSLHRRPGDWKPASLLSVSCRVTVSQPVFLASAHGVAIRRLTVAVCASNKLSQCERSCDCLACQWFASLHSCHQLCPTPWVLGLPWSPLIG